ncbi:50S ribosomal protein L11 methyltransferase [Rubrivirga sp.]|uniref:50S ribosomal protein L11 methyltransferase n=1 Tax=Rubrivirga sp. TaxID=1885344 RepID=UPI003B5288C8
MPDTLRLTLSIDDDAREPLVADLSDLGFDAFEETADGVVAYAPAPRWDGTTREAVAGLLRQRGLDARAMTEEIVPDQDWNAQWEASLQPIEAGPFVVAPSWTEVPPDLAGATVLRIDPKMAFGTGYHETTRIVLRLLADVVPAGGRVLDVGTGTGVLAIAALRLGAASAVGVDVDPWSVTNGRDNAALNGVEDALDVREGSIEAVPEDGFDLVVSNIIRSILEPLLPLLVAKARPEAPVVLSGLLATERERVVGVMAGLGYGLREEASENEWWGGVWLAGARGSGFAPLTGNGK